MTKRVVMAFGTRPEAIKMCPVALEFLSRPSEFDLTICVTGQHREMLDQVLRAFQITPDFDLAVMKPGQTLFDITSDVLLGFQQVLLKVKPDLVLVHGDTTTSFACALASFYLGIPVGHVEAGLRTGDIRAPFPEEFNRRTVDTLSDFYFAPTAQARQNLLNEGCPNNRIVVTGNTAIDALKTTISDHYNHPELDWAADSRLILITAHRRENLGEPMHAMFRAIRRVLDEHPDTKAVYPIHLNPRVRDAAYEELSNDQRIHLIEPLDVLDFHNFMAASHIILTDSGGIQEEAPSLGIPVLVMRNTTERPEGVNAGVLRLVGTNEQAIYTAFTELLNDPQRYEQMRIRSNPYGDGFASRRIADFLSHIRDGVQK